MVFKWNLASKFSVLAQFENLAENYQIARIGLLTQKKQNSNIELFTRFSLLIIYLNLSPIDKIDSQSGYWCVVIFGASVNKWVSVYYLINAGAVSSGQVFLNRSITCLHQNCSTCTMANLQKLQSFS